MDCPYNNLPDSSWWQSSVSGCAVSEINPHLSGSLVLHPTTKIGSAGSCFAQHISRSLVQHGYAYFVTEKAPETLPAQLATRYGYSVFSARYGNIYTPLQLVQLIERAFGRFQPCDQMWTNPSGRVFDLLRPRIMPNGYASCMEFESDLEQHLLAVKTLLQQVEVFVFTLGLTEAWRSRIDGTVYPTCPGCGDNPGSYDPDKYYFQNFNVSEVTQHLHKAIELIKEINSQAEIILTVSPVPLIATMEPRHVLQSSTYSKSVLRVAAEEMVRAYNYVHYFASYEFITGTCETNQFFEEDRRSITPEAVDQTMACFFKQFTDGQAMPTAVEGTVPTEMPADNPICDEEEFFRALAQKV